MLASIVIAVCLVALAVDHLHRRYDRARDAALAAIPPSALRDYIPAPLPAPYYRTTYRGTLYQRVANRG